MLPTAPDESEIAFSSVRMPAEGLNSRQQRNASLRQRIWHHASNVLIGVFIIATVVSNVRAITVAIVANCAQRVRSQSKKSLWDLVCGSAVTQVTLALAGLFLVPIGFWMGHIPAHNVYTFLRQVEVFWDGMLHLSMWPVVVATLIRALFLAHDMNQQEQHDSEATRKPSYRVFRNVFVICVLTAAVTVFGSQLQVVCPSWLWNPFLIGLKIYRPSAIHSHLEGICLNWDPLNPVLDQKDPLCLSAASWGALGGDVLDPKKSADVDGVVRGLKYAREESGGLIINIMARDTIDAIKPLRDNVEGLLPFFRDRLAVVVFENDSVDGTRKAFKEWSKEADGYKVDVMSCGEDNLDCVYGVSHRYDSTESKNYFMSSAIGKMADYRQRIVDYVIANEEYKDYSHMLVLDLDLGVSVSPFGILHTLGKNPDDVVASSGRQTWPGSLGTIVPPYDFSAFRVFETDSNRLLLRLHEMFCNVMPSGDRWRNQCDAVSPVQLMNVLGLHRLNNEEPYKVVSAFNGATLYPMKLVREKKATYNAGEDGQRCEHMSFNMGLADHMYVNPKWSFNVDPPNPGGPTGIRALRNVFRIAWTPQISLAIAFQIATASICFVYAIMVLGMRLIYPLLAATGLFGARRKTESSLPSTVVTDGSDYFDIRLPMLQPYASKRDVKHV